MSRADGKGRRAIRTGRLHDEPDAAIACLGLLCSRDSCQESWFMSFLNETQIESIRERFGTPIYVYDQRRL